MQRYSVKQLSKMAGVSVRTLHHYDELGLLTPKERTDAGYRVYGQKELIRLQQILFYKELDFSLRDIQELLDDPTFDYLRALQGHRKAIVERKTRLDALLTTIDKTILTLKGEQTMRTNEELYAGFTKEQAESIRLEAMDKYGKETVETSENNLRKLSKDQLKALKTEGEEIALSIAKLMHLAPDDAAVQQQIDRHYKHILQMWGGAVAKENIPQAYKGLATLYVEDSRFYEGIAEGFNQFLSEAIVYYADTRLA
ncbi:MAG: MerR family transcriptional regulator [Bacteroidota bacterium]